MEGSDERVAALLASLVLGLAVLLGAPVLVVLARRRSAEVRARWTRRWFLAGLLAVFWLDAAVVVHAFDVENESDYPRIAYVAAFACVVGLALAPWRDGRWRAALASPLLLALATWDILLVPWNARKGGVLAVERALGQPLDVLQAELPGAYVTVWVGEDPAPLPLDPETRVRDVDLVALAPRKLQVDVLGGCDLAIAGGIVVGARFNYD